MIVWVSSGVPQNDEILIHLLFLSAEVLLGADFLTDQKVQTHNKKDNISSYGASKIKFIPLNSLLLSASIRHDKKLKPSPTINKLNSVAQS